MKVVFTFFFLSILYATQAMAQDTGQERIYAAFDLLKVMGMEEQLKDSIDRMVSVELELNPGLVPYRHVLIKFYNKYIGFEGSRNEIAELYANTFTLEEIRELTEFYSTRLGKKGSCKNA